jgi:hypothetical protein
MLRLDTTTRKLQVVLAQAITTAQLPVMVSYSDKTSTTYNGATQLSNTNSTTTVDICSAPAASTVRDIDYVSIKNNDTVPAKVTIQLNDNGTIYTLTTITMQVGDTLSYTHSSGWQVITQNSSLDAIRQTFVTGIGFTAGTSTTLTLSVSPATANSMMVFFDGALQQHTEWTLSNSTITFSSAIPIGVLQVECVYSQPATLSVPGTGTVTASSFASNIALSVGSITNVGLTDLSAATSGQIQFPATQNASANVNTLDDYKEGTWTPNQGSGLTVVGAFTSSGSYTKVGRVVTISGIVQGGTSVSTSNGGIICSNLPFTNAANAAVGGCADANGTGGCCIGNPPTSSLWSYPAHSSSAAIWFTLTYFTA